MNCRTFRKLHVDFVDGALSDGRSAAIYEHLDGCARCARLDTAIRRGLLVARNLTQVQPSPEFMSRLLVRLHNPESRMRSHTRTTGTGIIAKVGAMVAVAVCVIFVLHEGHGRERLQPSVAPRAAATVDARPVAGILRSNGLERTTAEPEFRDAVTVAPGLLTSDSMSGYLIDAAVRASGLSP